MVGLGYLDLACNSPGYLEDHRSLYVQLIGLLVACLVAVAALGAVLHVGRLHPWLVAHRRRWRAWPRVGDRRSRCCWPAVRYGCSAT